MSQPENPSPPSPEEDPEVLPPEPSASQSGGGALQETRPETGGAVTTAAAGGGALPFIACYRCDTRVYLWGALDNTDEITEICPNCGESLHIARVSSLTAKSPDPAGRKKLKKGQPPPPLRERRPELKGAKEQIFFTQDKLQSLFPEETEETLRKRRLRGRILTIAGFSVCFFTGGYLGWRAGVTPPAPPPLLTGPLRAPAPAAPPPVLTTASAEEEKAARAALDAFLQAGSVADRLPWVLDPERLRQRMEEYYQTAESDARYLAGLDWKPSPQSDEDLRRGILILIQNAGPDLPPPRPPLILFFRRDPGEKQHRYRLDWETYVQERERLTDKFLTNPETPPGVFRVKMQRKHVFGQKSAPGAPPVLGCGVQSLTGASGMEVALPYGHPLYERFDRELKWTHPTAATVKLRWAESSGPDGPRLEIADFYCWEFAGVGRPPEKPLENITLPETPEPAPAPLGEPAPPPAPETPAGPAAGEDSGAEN